MKSKKSSKQKRKIVAVPVVQEAAIEPVVPVSVPRSEEKVTRDVLAIKRPNRLFLLVLLLGWIYDFLFWEHSAGVNFALLSVLCVLGGLYLLFSEGYKPARNTLWLLIPFVFFIFITFVRQESLTIFLAYIFTLFSIGLFATSYLGGRWHLYRLSNYSHKFLLLISDTITRPINFFTQIRKASSELDQDKNGFPIMGLVRGLIIALPILLFFGSLLASADVVFNQKLDNFFDTEKISEYIQRFILIIIFGFLLAGAFLHIATRSNDEKITEDDKPIIKPFLGFAESTVILGSVSLLFLMFVIVQFQYFFGGQTNIGVEGYTYSQYARRGFNELVTVAFFSLVMILGLSTVTRREHETQKKVYSGLSVGMVAMVMIILVSAYQRISLAIDWHGFSRLRLYPRIFLVWLGILLVAVVILEIYRRERYFAFAALLASLGFAVSLTLVNVDAAIVMHNVPRTLHGKNLNVAHLASLSVDAVPALANEFYSDKYSKQVHEGIGAALTCYLHFDSLPGAYQEDWRSFNLSRWRAHNALQNIENDLQDYGINAERFWAVKVRTPSNVWYDCRYYESSQEE
jgi:hypothetical protein